MGCQPAAFLFREGGGTLFQHLERRRRILGVVVGRMGDRGAQQLVVRAGVFELFQDKLLELFEFRVAVPCSFVCHSRILLVWFHVKLSNNSDITKFYRNIGAISALPRCAGALHRHRSPRPPRRPAPPRLSPPRRGSAMRCSRRSGRCRRPRRASTRFRRGFCP